MQSEYHPVLSQKKNRDELIKQYFHLQYTYKEILVSLACSHDIVLSYRHLKRLICAMGLRRRRPATEESSLAQIIAAINRELNGSGACLGYRALWKRLLTVHKLNVKRDTVLELLWLMDPEGVERRKCHRLFRRKYNAPGPNHVWHIDGYDKLKPFGFAIHGAIDGFSRKILWLQVARSNNDPKFIASYYLKTLKQLGIVPQLLRCDNGTENSWLQFLRPYFRSDCDDKFAGVNSIIFGKSTSNQRIESWWSQLRKSNADWWITFFKDLRDSNIYKDHLPLHKECLKFCFTTIIQHELDRVLFEWNSHTISKKRNSNGPSGKPDIMFFNPVIYNAHDHDTAVDIEDVNSCLEMYGIPNQNEKLIMEEFLELIKILKPGINIPTCVEDGKALFLELTHLLDNMR